MAVTFTCMKCLGVAGLSLSTVTKADTGHNALKPQMFYTCCCGLCINPYHYFSINYVLKHRD